VDRRTFGKLFAGAATVLGIPAVEQAEGAENAHGAAASASTTHAANSDWELVILDGAPPHMTETGGAASADIDGDGKTELVVCGNGALLWYRPSTGEKGLVALGHFAVGVALRDLDHDGRMEIMAGKLAPVPAGSPENWDLSWYKSGRNLQDPWSEFVFDGDTAGHPHDLIFGDLDGDGDHELVANAMYCDHPGLFAYKIPKDPHSPWKKQCVQRGLSAEGTAAGDLNGDGKDELVQGPYWFSAPREGAFSGKLWKTHAIAPGYRELCRAQLIDITGNGCPM
jgi:hypothetical protein